MDYDTTSHTVNCFAVGYISLKWLKNKLSVVCTSNSLHAGFSILGVAGVCNLIDLGDQSGQAGRCEPEYVNDAIIKKTQLHDVSSKDPFDMRE